MTTAIVWIKRCFIMINMQTIHVVPIGLFALALIGSTRLSVAGNGEPQESPLPPLEEATSMDIQDDWGGLSYTAPIGVGPVCSYGGIAAKPRKATVDIEIPLAVAQAFFKDLAKSPLKEGEYRPKIFYSDDYPSIRIELKINEDTVAFFTQSQGEGHVPWGVRFRGKTYVVDSDVPSKAYQALYPYLKRDILRNMVKEVVRECEQKHKL